MSPDTREPAPRVWRGRARRFWFAGVRPTWIAYRWPAVVALALGAVVLGHLGYRWHFDATGEARSFADTLYASLQLFWFESGSLGPPVPWPLQVARFLAPAVLAFTAISALAAILRDQFARLRVRWFADEHVLVCGLGRIGVRLAREFRHSGYEVVAIEDDEENSAIGELREEGIAVLVGDATDSTLLRTAGVGKARQLFVVTGDDQTNVAVALDAWELVGEGREGRPLACFVHLLDPDLLNLITEAGVGTREGDPLRLEAFNVAERGAPALLARYPAFVLDGETPTRPPHVLVVGLGQMGRSLVVQAARAWRRAFGRDAEPMTVTVVDEEADAKIASLCERYPRLEEACRFRPHRIEVESAEFRRAGFLDDPDGRGVTAVYVCLGDDVQGLNAAALLRRRIPDRAVPVVVRTTERAGPAALIGRLGGGVLAGLHVFGLLELVCRPDVVLEGRNEELARAIHEAYVLAQRREGKTPEDNPSMVRWEELPEGLRESNRRQASDMDTKLRAVGCVALPETDWGAEPITFTPEEVEVMAGMEHDRWWRERAEEGWVLADEKDVDRRRSPYLVPYEELPEEVREYDRNAVREIPGLLARVGFAAVRVTEG
ncbi:MAG: NAD-binding protein [Actinobacteria bacterium]|nr:NAD-binding protein [Actinomycetota bacterium]